MLKRCTEGVLTNIVLMERPTNGILGETKTSDFSLQPIRRPKSLFKWLPRWMPWYQIMHKSANKYWKVESMPVRTNIILFW